MKKKSKFTKIETMIAKNKGKIFILVDDENRENEGDLIFMANKLIHQKLILWQNMVVD